MEKVVNIKQILLNHKHEDSAHVYKILIHGMCSTGYMKEARLQFSDMKMKGLEPDMSILNWMLVGYINENKIINSSEILSFMLKNNIFLSMSSYRKLVRLNCFQGRLITALSLKSLFTVVNASDLITLYNIIIFAIFQTGHSLFVEYVLNNIEEKKLTLNQASYEFLIYGYDRCSKLSKSIETFNVMIAKNLKPSIRSFRIAICNLCNSLEIGKALELSSLMELWGIKHSTAVQSTLVGCLLLQGKLVDAEALLSRLEHNDLIPKNICYDNLIKMLCMHKRVHKAIDLLNIMLKRGSLPSEVSYNSVINGLLHLKDFDQALDFIAEMHHKNMQPTMEICVALIHGLCGCGRTEDARKILELSLTLGKTVPDNVIRSIIESYVAESNPHKASAFMHIMRQRGHLPDFKTHWSLISNLNHSNHKQDKEDKAVLSRLLSQSGFSFGEHSTKL